MKRTKPERGSIGGIYIDWIHRLEERGGKRGAGLGPPPYRHPFAPGLFRIPEVPGCRTDAGFPDPRL